VKPLHEMVPCNDACQAYTGDKVFGFSSSRSPFEARGLTPTPDALGKTKNLVSGPGSVLVSSYFPSENSLKLGLTPTDLHIGRSVGEVDTDGGAQSEHGRSSTTAMSWRRVWGSKPGATAIRRPLSRSSSRGRSGGSGGGDGIGEDGDGEEVGSGAVGGERVRRGRLRGGCLVEAFSEGRDGDAASLAEFGVGQAAPTELVEEGVPAGVEDVAPRHGVISRTGLSAPSRE